MGRFTDRNPLTGTRIWIPDHPGDLPPHPDPVKNEWDRAVTRRMLDKAAKLFPWARELRSDFERRIKQSRQPLPKTDSKE